MKLNKIYHIDALTGFRKLPTNSIDTIITSPPYWCLRDYATVDVKWDDGWVGSLGDEPTISQYITHLCDIFAEARRALKPTGSCWVVIGDTPSSGAMMGMAEREAKEGDKVDSKFVCEGYEIPPAKSTPIPYTSLCLIPFRFAIAMVDRGYILRNTIIWYKPNAKPSSVTNRFTIDFEYIFFFVQSNTPRYWINPVLKRLVTTKPLGTRGAKDQDWEWRPCSRCRGTGRIEKVVCDRCEGEGVIRASLWTGRSYYFQQQFEPMQSAPHSAGRKDSDQYGNDPLHLKRTLGIDSDRVWGDAERGRNKRTVWRIHTRGFKGAHFAVFPTKILQTPFDAGCPRYVCPQCGMPREKVYRTTKLPAIEDYKGRAIKQYKGTGAENPSQLKRRILESMRTARKFHGWTDCGCEAGWVGGVVVDPFMGSGTTALVALKMSRRFIGFELNSAYIKIAYERIDPWLHQSKLTQFFAKSPPQPKERTPFPKDERTGRGLDRFL